MQREADFAGILGETFDLFGAAIRYVVIYITVVGITGAIGIAANLVQPSNNLFSWGGGVRLDASSTVTSVLFQISATVVSVVAAYFLLTKLLETRGRLGAGGTRIWAYVGLTILWTLGALLGFMLLVVPGIIVLVRWSASTGFLLGADEDVVGSLSRSWDATRGHSWAIFFAALVMLLGVGVGGSVLGGLAGLSGSELAISSSGALIEAFGNAVMFCFAIAVYSLVSDDTDETAGIFE